MASKRQTAKMGHEASAHAMAELQLGSTANKVKCGKLGFTARAKPFQQCEKHSQENVAADAVVIRENRHELMEKRARKVDSLVLADAHDFGQLVQNNTANTIADNTLFLKEIVKERDNVGFFFPRRFCKTILLSMTEFFLNIHVDKEGIPLRSQWTEEREVFRTKFDKSNILLNDENFALDNVLGKHICIRMSMKCSNVRTYNEFKVQFQWKFAQLFKKYAWLEKALSSSAIDRRKFRLIVAGQANDVHLHFALSDLATWLQSHFLNLLETEPDSMQGYSKENFQRVLIILDDFDHILHPRVRSSPDAPKVERERMCQLFESIISTTFESTGNIRGIVAGYYPTAHWVSNSFKAYTVLYASKYAEFFGFHETDFNHLCDKFEVNGEDRKVAKVWYNGYTVHGLSGKTYCAFNPQNVIQFLIDRKEQSQNGQVTPPPFSPHANIMLRETFDIQIFAKLFRKESVAKRIATLLNPLEEVWIEIRIIWQFQERHIEELKLAVNDSNWDSEELADLFCTFLIYAGYFDAKRDTSAPLGAIRSTCKISIPNLLHKSELLEKMEENYYQQKFKPFYAHVPATQRALEQFYKAAASGSTRGDDDEQQLKSMADNFLQKCNTVFEAMPEFGDIRRQFTGQAVHPNEDLFHTFFNSLALPLFETSLFGTEVYCKCPKRPYAEKEVNIRSDTSFADFSVKIAVQIEHKFGRTTKLALEEAVDYFNIFSAHLANGCVDRILFVGINLSPEKEVDMEYFVYKNDEESEQKRQQIRNGTVGCRGSLARTCKNH